MPCKQSARQSDLRCEIGVLAEQIGDAIKSAAHSREVADIRSEVKTSVRSIGDRVAVALSGGVFQNKFLMGRTVSLLKERGLEVFTHSDVNTNDSGIPIGQIAIANARGRCV